MTESERDRLMQFLQALKQTRLPHYDRLAHTLIDEGLAAQPRAAYLLVHRCMVLQEALDDARKTMAQAALAPQTGAAALWECGETAWGINAQGSPHGPSSGSAPAAVDGLAYLLRDAQATHPTPQRSLEDRAVLFLGNNAGKVWMLIAAAAAAVVYLVK